MLEQKVFGQARESKVVWTSEHSTDRREVRGRECWRRTFDDGCAASAGELHKRSQAMRRETAQEQACSRSPMTMH